MPSESQNANIFGGQPGRGRGDFGENITFASVRVPEGSEDGGCSNDEKRRSDHGLVGLWAGRGFERGVIRWGMVGRVIRGKVALSCYQFPGGVCPLFRTISWWAGLQLIFRLFLKFFVPLFPCIFHFSFFIFQFSFPIGPSLRLVHFHRV